MRKILNLSGYGGNWAVLSSAGGTSPGIPSLIQVGMVILVVLMLLSGPLYLLRT